MTVGDLLQLAWRHWVTSLVALVVISAGLLFATERQEAYNGEVNVLLLAPPAVDANALAGTTASLVATTGLVSGVVNGPGTPDLTVGDQTLASLGISQGWSVRQPNSGGQWETSFQDPILDVRSTGPTLAVAQAQMADALARVDQALAAVQDAQNIPADLRIRTVVNPAGPLYAVQNGSRTRAIGAVGLLGLLGWGAALLLADRVRPGVRARGRRAERREEPALAG